MIRSNIVRLSITAIVLIVIFVAVFKWIPSNPVLTVYLRCNGENAGTLFIATLPENAKQDKKSFDLETVCKAKKIELNSYLQGENLQFLFQSSNGKTFNLTSEYGRDIQSDPHGFHMILTINKTPPFIDNGRL